MIGYKFLFNYYFSKQYDNREEQFCPSKYNFRNGVKNVYFEICSGDNVKIIRSLDLNKAHGDNKISIRMIKTNAFSLSVINNN